jgi:acyl carrier protein
MYQQDEAMNTKINVIEEVISAINAVKRTGFTEDSIELDFYLGGDLGIDSREMLEIWYEIEQRLGIRVGDSEKRDLYTLGDVVAKLGAFLGEQVITA